MSYNNLHREILESLFIKEGQTPPPDLPPFQTPTAPPAPVARQNTLSPNEVAKKLVNRLSRELTGQKEITNISSDTPTSVDLGVGDLQSLGKLLQFLSNNKIKIDGNRVVYSEQESNSLPEEEQNKLSPISINMSRDSDTRKWNTADYYTHLPSLIKYTSYLQNKAVDLKKSGDLQGRVLEVMVGKLIDSINAIKSDSGLSRTPKSHPEKPNELPDNTILDGFGTKIFDVRDPFSDKGNIQLTSKDLSSREALNAWLKAGPEAQTISLPPPPSQLISGEPAVKFSEPNSNHCIIIYNLYRRASNLARTSSSPEDTKKYNFYLQKISQLGITFTDPSGKACSVTSPNTTLDGKYNFVPGQEAGAAGKGEGKVSRQILEQIIQSLPLDTQEIDFNRIRRFFGLYLRVSSSDNIQSAITAANTANTAMDDATRLTLTGNQQAFRMTRNVPELISWLKSSDDKTQLQAGNYALKFLNDLQQIIIETGKVLGMFYNEFGRSTYSGDRVVLNSEQKALVEAQYLGPSSIFAQNLREIQALATNFRDAVSRQRAS